MSLNDIVSSTKEITDNSYIDEHVYQEEENALKQNMAGLDMKNVKNDELVSFVLSRHDVVPDDRDYDKEMMEIEEAEGAAARKIEDDANPNDPLLRRPMVLGDGDRKEDHDTKPTPQDLVLPTLSPVPPSLQCCICKKLLKKAMKLSCDNSQVCWGCGVKEITKSHTCWSCQQTRISSSHLSKDDQLRDAVEDFLKTGTISATKLENVEEVHEVEEEADARQVCLDQADGLQITINQKCSDGFDFTHFIFNEGDKSIMKAEEVFSVKVSDPAGLAKLHDGSLLVCNTSTHSVVRCCQKSMTQIKIGPNREFQNPTDVLACSSGEVVIADARGLHLFDSSLTYVKSLLIAIKTINRSS